MSNVPMPNFTVEEEAKDLLAQFYSIRDPKIDQDPLTPTKTCLEYQMGPKYFDVLAAYALQLGDPDNHDPKIVPFANEFAVEMVLRANKRLHFVPEDGESKLTTSIESLVNRGVMGKVTSSHIVTRLMSMKEDEVNFYWLIMCACVFAMWRPRVEIVYKMQANAYLTYANRFFTVPDAGQQDYNLYLCNDRAGFMKSLQHILKRYTVESTVNDVSKTQMEMVAIMSRILIAFTLSRTAEKDEYRKLGMAYITKLNQFFASRIRFYQKTTPTEIN